MSGGRLPAPVGIVIGGAVGAIAALVGLTRSPSPSTEAPPLPSPQVAPARAKHAAAPSAELAPTAVDSASSAPSADTSVPAAVSAPATVAPAQESASAAAAAPKPSPALDLPTTRDALLRAEMLCDQRKDFDQCARAAAALEKGTSGPPDLDQAKRFKRIESTYLVMQCEGGMPHACFVLASKYRSGTDVVANEASATALEKRGAELCRGRSAPECP